MYIDCITFMLSIRFTRTGYLLSTFLGTNLLCIILEKQGKLAEVVEVMLGEKSKYLTTDDIFKRTKIADLLHQVGKVDEANAIYRQLLLEKPDNWAFYTSYISTILELVDSQYTPQNEGYVEM